MNKKTKALTRYAAVVAIVFVGIAIDSALTASAGIKMAVATLIVVLPLTQLFGLKESMLACLTFGLLSMARAYAFPSVTSPAFMRIEVSVLPRLAIGLTAHYSYKCLYKFCSKSANSFVKKFLASAVSGGVGMLTNTVLVLTAMSLGNGNVIDKIISALVATYGIIELAVSVIVVPVVTDRLRRIFGASDFVSSENE